jgi:hypothetical protein
MPGGQTGFTGRDLSPAASGHTTDRTPKIVLPRPLTFIGRQNRAWVLVRWLLAAGPIQKSQMKPAALPGPRRTRRLGDADNAAPGFCFEPDWRQTRSRGGRSVSRSPPSDPNGSEKGIVHGAANCDLGRQPRRPAPPPAACRRRGDSVASRCFCVRRHLGLASGASQRVRRAPLAAAGRGAIPDRCAVLAVGARAVRARARRSRRGGRGRPRRRSPRRARGRSRSRHGAHRR